MKAILQFNLPEEQDEFEVAQNGWKYRRVISDIDQYLRTVVKYGDVRLCGGVLDAHQWAEAADKFRATLRAIADENEVPID